MSDYIVHKAVELSALSAKARAKITEDTWVISPKFDGCHAIFLIAEGVFFGAFSRSGEVVKSMDHIGKLLEQHYPKGQWAVCGEAWQKGKEFNEISGMFRRQSPQPELQFVPFDCVPFSANVDTFTGAPVDLGHFQTGQAYDVTYVNRIHGLSKLCDGVSILCSGAWTINGTLEEAYEIATRQGKINKARTDGAYDGAVLAQAHGLYKVGSGKGGEFIKCKPLLSETVTVNALFPDTGEKTGKNTLALGFTLNGKAQKVSTGLTQEQVDSFIKDNRLILGQRIEVEAMGLTVNGLLREPRFKGIRTDA